MLLKQVFFSESSFFRYNISIRTERDVLMLKDKVKEYITNKEINIPESDWNQLKKEFSKEDIILALATLISEEEIQMPLTKMTLKEALLAEKELSELDTSIKDGEFYTRYEDDSILSNSYFDESNKYNVVNLCCPSITSNILTPS